MDNKNTPLSSQLNKVAKGSGIIFIGSILGSFMGLLSRIIIVRYITPVEFGILSIALVIVNILVIVSLFGFEHSVPRYISHALSKKDFPKVRATIVYSIKFAISISIFTSLALFLLAPWLGSVFSKPALIVPIRILAFTVPLLVLTNLLISILRGLENVKAKLYFQNIIPWATRIVLLGLVILFGLAFKGVLYTYLIVGVLTAISLVYYSKKTIRNHVPDTRGSYSIANFEFIAFSLPLLGTSISLVMMSWTDTLMLSYFKSAEVVGLYNIAFLSSRLVDLPVQAVTFIYLPVASQFFAEGRSSELKRFYSVVTKWTFFGTFPLLLLMFFDADSVLNLLFSGKSVGASIALQLIIISKFVSILNGPNGMTMISLGKTKTIMYATLTSMASNVFLNFLLIPKYGIEGAAAASAFSLIIANIALSVFMYRYSSIHPFTRDYLKPIAVTFVVGFVFYRLTGTAGNLSVLFRLIIVTLISLGSILITRSIAVEDIFLLETLERKILNNNRLTNRLAIWMKVK